MEEINIPMVKGSMDDIGDEEVNFSPTVAYVNDYCCYVVGKR